MQEREKRLCNVPVHFNTIIYIYIITYNMRQYMSRNHSLQYTQQQLVSPLPQQVFQKSSRHNFNTVHSATVPGRLPPLRPPPRGNDDPPTLLKASNFTGFSQKSPRFRNLNRHRVPLPECFLWAGGCTSRVPGP